LVPLVRPLVRPVADAQPPGQSGAGAQRQQVRCEPPAAAAALDPLACGVTHGRWDGVAFRLGDGGGERGVLLLATEQGERRAPHLVAQIHSRPRPQQQQPDGAAAVLCGAVACLFAGQVQRACTAGAACRRRIDRGGREQRGGKQELHQLDGALVGGTVERAEAGGGVHLPDRRQHLAFWLLPIGPHDYHGLLGVGGRRRRDRGARAELHQLPGEWERRLPRDGLREEPAEQDAFDHRVHSVEAERLAHALEDERLVRVRASRKEVSRRAG